ncbi:efflux RND transporter periplasmic adaptor subunit [Chryseobacterium populi]|uniref:RND family efflux transporter, MFP subunit n=1 Tax=Chryseobacterium populi TaxID=1144316 RepID=J2KE33_9FLAO|nr:efflux RND transporter periplasmic adaptor subunit [Chryseobacterium populi]EJL71428.1 RND family efflux transporter, MFP subunit [Chryseobacterium populi]
MKRSIYIISAVLFLTACGSKENNKQPEKNVSPTVSNNGKTITFQDAGTFTFFKTEKITSGNINADITAPAQVVATVVENRIILFNDPELSANYTELINQKASIAQKKAIVTQKQAIVRQKQAIIRQKQVEIQRFQDLFAHGASTGKEVADARVDKMAAESDLNTAVAEKAAAEADLIAQQSLILEQQSKLKMAGFNPDALLGTDKGKAWIIADIPESQAGKIKEGGSCQITFNAFPNENFTGLIEDIADVIDNTTRMIKLRISIDNADNKLRSGMFATISFGVHEGDFISIPKSALATVQAKNYVFVKKGSGIFQRREVNIGSQVGERIVVYKGLNDGEEIAVEGVMQLKGLSFGY